MAHLSAPGAADAAQNGGLGSSNHHLLGESPWHEGSSVSSRLSVILHATHDSQHSSSCLQALLVLLH